MGNSPVVTLSYNEPGKCSSLFQSCSSLSELDVDELAIHKEIGAPRGKLCVEAMRYLDTNSKSLLFAATSHNSIQIRRFLAYGISPETYDQNRTSPLHIASRAGSIEVVKELISNHCNINITDCAGWTSLHIASHCGQSDIVDLLLACGADATIVNSKGQTPFDLAREPSTQKIFLKYWGAQDKIIKKEGFRARPITPYSQESSVTGDSWMRFGKINIAMDLKVLEEVFRNVFNNNYKKGLAMLVAGGIIEQQAYSLAVFLFTCPKLNPVRIGEVLGDPQEFFREVCKEYMNFIQIEPHNLLGSLTKLLRTIKLPKGLMADQILSCFSSRFFSFDGPFSSQDSVHRLVFSIISLNYSMHSLKEKVDKDDFIIKTKGMHDGGDFPEKYLTWIYDTVSIEPLEGVFYEQVAPVFDEVVVSGYLKYKTKNDWKEKYFILNSKTLWCFRASTEIAPYGFIPLWKVVLRVKGQIFCVAGEVNFWKFSEDGQACLQRFSEILFKMDAPELWISGLRDLTKV